MQKKIIRVAAIFFLATVIPALAANHSSPHSDLGSRLKAMLAKNHYALSEAAVILRNLDTDSTIVAVNADAPFNPASVSKLATAAMAFEKLGTNYTFKTCVYLDSAFDPALGACNGNLYLKGGGDPSFFIERMWLFIQNLRYYGGLKKIAGDIILDDSFFDSVSIGPCFNEESDVDNPYAAPVGALSDNFNSVSICLRPGLSIGSPVQVDIFPDLTNIEVVNSAITIAPGKKSDCIANSEKSIGSPRIVVSGSMAKDAGPCHIQKRIWQPLDNFESTLRMLLRDNKIDFKGEIRKGVVPAAMLSGGPFYEYESPPLREIVNGMMKFSNNFYAEMIFKTISAQQDSGSGSWENSSRIAQAWWKAGGLPGSPVIKNGSGMGDCNRFSALQIISLLKYVWSKKTFLPEYLDALPVAGIDGTLHARFRDSALKGYVRGKTGTLNSYGVCTIAGYALLPKANYAFVILFNTLPPENPHKHWEMQQKILEMLLLPGGEK